MPTRNQSKKTTRSTTRGSSRARNRSLLSAASDAWGTATKNVPPLKEWTLAVKNYLQVVVISRLEKNSDNPPWRWVLGGSRHSAA